MKKVFVGILRWLLKEWVKALLGVLAFIFVGFVVWAFRAYIKSWLIAKHSLDIRGWAWVLLLLLLIVSSVILTLLITYKRKPKTQILKDSRDIKIALQNWWQEEKESQQCISRRGMRGPLSSPISFTSVDRQCKVKKGSAKRYLPKIISKDPAYSVDSQGEKTLTVKII